MMLIVLDSNPVKAANKVPDKLKFKQLLELAQMICSCGYSNIYKKIPQGKAIQEWIKRNPAWTKTYGAILLSWCCGNINLKEDSFKKIFTILASVLNPCDLDCEIQTAVFRYSKEYKNTSYATDSELPIDEAVKEYNKYMEWKQNV